MRILLRIVLGLVLLVVLLGVVGFFLPRQYRVERSALIQAPPEQVLAPCADLREWRKWGVWYERDPAMTTTYSTPPTGVGSWVEWKSKSQGDGRMTITALEPAKVAYNLAFPDMDMEMTGTLLATPEGAATRLSWVTAGDLGMNPMNRWFGLFLDKMLGPDFEAGLANLKQLVEK